MKILLAITTLGAGGAEKMIAVLAGEYIRKGHAVTVLCLSAPPENPHIPRQLATAGASVHYLSLGKFSLSMLARIRKAVREIRPDLVHSHLIHPNILFRLAMKGLHIPLVNTVHIAERRPGKKLFFLLDGWTYRLADSVTAVSAAAARYHEKVCSIPENGIRVIRNGVDPVPEAPPERKKETAEEFRFDRYHKIIGSIGRLDWQKGYDLLFSRIPALAGRIPDGERWLLIVFGEGPEKEKLETLAKKNSSEKLRIILGGFRKDAASLTGLFDVFVMPSRYEGYGLALAEAMTFGLPVVCSDADSLPELCVQYEAPCRIVDFARDTDGNRLADAILECAKESRGRGQVIQTQEGMAEEYLKLYEEIRSGKA